ncbi:MAG TPA: DUF1365 domain-containing protein [Azospira sp.]|nr:DUF1365 domain-containing protein [Azospira sp.]
MSALRIGFGQVMHRRVRPAVHAFRYPVFYVRLRLQDLASAAQPLFGINRGQPLAVHEADHGPRDGSPLLPWVRELLAREGVAADGEIWLQTFPRVFGYVFNPVSFWFCHDRDGGLRAVLAEVNNTFGEHHNYLLVPAGDGCIEPRTTLLARKVFHVSPFMAVRGHYRFRFHLRADGGDGAERGRESVSIVHADDDGDLLLTAIAGVSRPATTRLLLRALLAYPWQSVGVVARIHWQALRLWLKRVPFFTKPHPPLEEITR